MKIEITEVETGPDGSGQGWLVSVGAEVVAMCPHRQYAEVVAESLRETFTKATAEWWLARMTSQEVPADEPTEDGPLATAARDDYRATLAAGQQLTGQQLGERHGRSARWGRMQIAAVKAENGTQPPVANVAISWGRTAG